MEVESSEWHLAAAFGVGAEARCVATLDDDNVVVGGSDNKATVWQRSATSGSEWSVVASCANGSAMVAGGRPNTVNAVLAFSGDALLGGVAPAGGFITGCLDGLIRVFRRDGALLLTGVGGHAGGIKSLDWAGTLLVSGDQKGRACVWSVADMSILQTLDDAAAENSLAVMALPSGGLVTGSSGTARNPDPRVGGGVAMLDVRTRVYARVSESADAASAALAPPFALAATLDDHTQRVCALAPCDVGFITGSYDGSCALRTPDGAVAQRSAFDGWVTCLAVRGDVAVAGVGDPIANAHVLDATRGFARTAALPHPNMIWGLAILGSGDVVTACHDGAVRVWSRDATRVADASLVALLDEGEFILCTVTFYANLANSFDSLPLTSLPAVSIDSTKTTRACASPRRSTRQACRRTPSARASARTRGQR
jgi:WD40 repeat protein